MAVADWLNANVYGNTSVADLGGAAIDFYDTYQTNEGRQDAVDEIVGGYNQGIGTVQDLAGESKDTLGNVYDTNTQNIQPYMEAGTTALDQYMGLLEDPSTIAQDPAYQWRYDTGIEARKRDLEAAGYADPMGSGARATGINDWASGFASQELDKALNRDLPIIQAGQEGVRQGIVSGDTYSRGITGINNNLGGQLVDLYTGRANAESTKMMLDSMAMSSYLQGANGLLNQAAGSPDIMDMLTAALMGGANGQGAQTSDGQSLWGMLGDAFGFDPSDQGIVGTVMDAVTGGSGEGGAGGDNWGAGGLDSILSGVSTTGGGWAVDKALGGAITDLFKGSQFGGVDWSSLLQSSGAIQEGAVSTAANSASWGQGGLDAALGGAEITGGGYGGGSLSTLGSGTAGAEAGATSGIAGAATTSFGSWAATALGGFGALMAVASVVDMLRSGDSRFTKAMKGMDKADDPLKWIADLGADSGKLPMVSGFNNQGVTMRTGESKGMLYSTILKNLPPENMEAIKYHNNIGTMVNDLKSYLTSGFGSSSKHTKGANPTKALSQLFPEASDIINKLNQASQGLFNNQEADFTSADESPWNIRMRDEQTDRYKAAKERYTQELNAIIRPIMAGWQTEKQAGAA